jgi:hypothetical protein
VSDIAEKLLAAIVAVERIAEKVPEHLSGPWRASDTEGYCGDDYKIRASTGQEVVGPGYEGGGAWGVEVRDLIVLGDPQSVLRRCAADREIVAEHGQLYVGGCTSCVTPGWGYPTHGGSRPADWPCKTITALARGYGVTRPGEAP